MLRIAAAMFLLTASRGALHASVPSNSDRANLHRIAQEVEIANILGALDSGARSDRIVFRDVAVVDVVSHRSVPGQSVIVRDGRIAWVGAAAATDRLDVGDAQVVEGRGMYLSPGLTDMHVHTESLAEQLLRLANGETSVREMDGFPWLLELRRAIGSGALLAPTSYIAGTIIASAPLGGYAVVVSTPEEARAVVRREAACGYDFIKVHNLLPQPLFDAVADETRLAGMDLVGHIPHDISIDHALHVGHMRTVEHLKGFLIDETLTVSTENYAQAVAGVEYWQTPTLYTYLHYLHGDAARAQLERFEMRYVSAARRADWQAQAAASSASDERILGLLVTAQHAAIERLLRLGTHWLAGTDAAQRRYNIAGIALLDELRLMQQFGIPQAEVLRAATSEPAAAMQRDDFGQIKHGLRADLVLLDADPTQDLNAYHHNRGVLVRGHWLTRAALDTALDRLAQVEAEPDRGFPLTAPSLQTLQRALSRLAAKHIALEASSVHAAANSLRTLGYASIARSVEAVAAAPTRGMCEETTPD